MKRVKMAAIFSVRGNHLKTSMRATVLSDTAVTVMFHWGMLASQLTTSMSLLLPEGE
ncbi:MAG: hypothetical protein R2851_09390 [Caldilineaceae bacterium]